ncbi:filamentation induced By CAMP protein Fic [Corallococcus coralloides DSM 2259]|uniref:Filamentation induced By CAMP protein Fic n=1 Tax=Corallococcus coralloides (strain ATCC 25202 / DSM 2259 / NBRC 100086 / M2) TaxID=1144275 RepID=H8MWC2_CORCM|nr:Fic family protein [Corallococcus coralloides]AFE07782.1 filamentation induced By CAMP protein Fic [Corallococcus coralloides DSM 2259]
MHRYRWSESIEPRLQQATERMRRLRATRMPPAAVQSLRHWFRIHHTYNSNAIEGNRLTLPETRAVVEDGITIAGKSLKDHFEAVNLAHALDFVEALASKETVLGERDVREMHGIVLRGIDPENAGVYRRINVRIGGTEHVPPEAVRVPEEMRKFGEWLAGAKNEHPLVVCAIAHAWFETIHPFVDGNGRTGRLIANLLLMREQYPAIVLLVEDRARYYTALDASHSGDITPMVELTLDRLDQSFEEYERASREILKVQEPAIEYLAKRMNTARVNTSPEFMQWRIGLESLHDALEFMAQSLTRRISAEVRVQLTVTPRPQLTEQDWGTIKRKRFPLFSLQAESSLCRVNMELQSNVYSGSLPGWKAYPPVIYLRGPSGENEPPSRFVEAVPTGHLFRVLRGSKDLAAYLWQERATPSEMRGQQPPPPPPYQVEVDVSATQIATEIWTYVIDHLILPASS